MEISPEKRALRAEARTYVVFMNRARGYNEVTCPASRHAAMIAEALAKGTTYQMLIDGPEHCAMTIAAVVRSLWEARAELNHEKKT
jgi:hypothetical protein